jgi:L-rhamnose mutarotase
LEQRPFFGVFIDLKKAFDAMDQGRCLTILALHGVGPQMLRLIRNFWETATNMCRAKGNYGRPFKAGRAVTQGGALSAKLFNILVNAVVREWMRLMRETLDDSDGQLAVRMKELFAIFYVDDGYIASRDAEFLQEALNILGVTFKRTGLATNTKKIQARVCTPGKIRVQLPTDSYNRMREGVAAGEESKRAVVWHVCEKTLQARSLRSHLESTHDIYQQVVVPNGLLEERAGIRYKAERVGCKMSSRCPSPGCPGKLSSACMLRRHFRDLHPTDSVEVPWEGHYPQCERCAMQCNLKYPRHIHSQVCQTGAERRTQRDSAITSALALRQLFYVKGEVLEKVESFLYLGRILAQDDEDVRAVRSQIKKAGGTWARVGQVLQADNTPPKVSAMFYKAVVQSVLLYGSKTWNLTTTALARLEGFHIRAAYPMTKVHKPQRGPNHVWVYPATSDVLKECGMHTITHYISVRRETILQYVVDRPIHIACKVGERRRGSAPRQWWWEQKMCLDDKDADKAGE